MHTGLHQFTTISRKPTKDYLFRLLILLIKVSTLPQPPYLDTSLSRRKNTVFRHRMGQETLKIQFTYRVSSKLS